MVIPVTRKARFSRKTAETTISVSVNLDGTGKTDINTGISFLDHLVAAFGKHGMMDLNVTAKSGDGIVHHLVEDTAISVGMALDKALGQRKGITRFGHASIPMDESLAEASVDLVKRPYWKLDLKIRNSKVEEIPGEHLLHFFQSLLQNLNCTTHLVVRYGQNDHHMVESAIKSLAVALRKAASADGRNKGIPSTKGSM